MPGSVWQVGSTIACLTGVAATSSAHYAKQAAAPSIAILLVAGTGTSEFDGGVARWAAPYTCGQYEAACPGSCAAFDAKAIKFQVARPV